MKIMTNGENAKLLELIKADIKSTGRIKELKVVEKKIESYELKFE